MKRVIAMLALVSVLTLGAGGFLVADESGSGTPLSPTGHPEQDHPSTGSQSATDPSAILFQLGFSYWSNVTTFTPDLELSDTTTLTTGQQQSAGETFLFQPVLPMTRTNLLRPALPIVRTPDLPGASSVEGIGDLFLLDLFFFHQPHSTFGVGPVASLPTASEDALGSGKFQLGASFVYLYKGFTKDLPGILLYNQWSVAGDSGRRDINNLSFQIVWVHHFQDWYMGWTDQTGLVDWENDSRVTFPVGVKFGKVFQGKTPMNAAVQLYYTIQEGRDNVYGIKFSASFIKPKWMRHTSKK